MSPSPVDHDEGFGQEIQKRPCQHLSIVSFVDVDWRRYSPTSSSHTHSVHNNNDKKNTCYKTLPVVGVVGQGNSAIHIKNTGLAYNPS